MELILVIIFKRFVKYVQKGLKSVVDPDSTFYFDSDQGPSPDPVSTLKLGQGNTKVK